jgi:hypothetical protein
MRLLGAMLGQIGGSCPYLLGETGLVLQCSASQTLYACRRNAPCPRTAAACEGTILIPQLLFSWCGGVVVVSYDGMASVPGEMGLSALPGGMAVSTSRLPKATTPAKKRNTMR